MSDNTKCPARLHGIPCSFESGHKGSHENCGLWWRESSDPPAASSPLEAAPAIGQCLHGRPLTHICDECVRVATKCPKCGLYSGFHAPSCIEGHPEVIALRKELKETQRQRDDAANALVKLAEEVSRV